MNEATHYLAPDVLVEPLIDRWLAWAYLLSPATRALYVTGSHLKLLRAFATTPQMHVNALKNPAMRGGPYVDLPISAAPAVKELFEKTTASTGHLAEFAEALKGVERLLAEEAKGYSLEALYKRVPNPARGFVELVYDLYDNPSARIIEGLMFESRYHEPARQSLRLTRSDPDHRPLGLTTPRLVDANELSVHLPFSSKALDALYAARHTAVSAADLAQTLGLDAQGKERLASLLTAEKPSPRAAATGPRVRYFGHGCVLIEDGTSAVLVDPVISTAAKSGPPRLTFADLPEQLDAVLVTESHPDHFVMETLLELRHRTKTFIVPRSNGGSLCDPSLKLILEHAGFSNVREVRELDDVQVGKALVTPLPFLGKHGDLDVRSKLGYSVRLAGKHVVLLSETNNLAPTIYKNIATLLGQPADVLMVGTGSGGPMSWLYGPLFVRPIVRKNDLARRTDASDGERALALTETFGAKNVLVYSLGTEPWLGHLVPGAPPEGSKPLAEADKLVASCQARGVPAERLHLSKDIAL